MKFKDKNILIIKYSSLGDIINAMPAVAHLRRCEPEAKIYWLVKKVYADLLESVASIDGIIVLETKLKLAKKLISLKVDITIDLQGLLKSATIGLLTGAKRRVCFPHTREGSTLLYTEKLGIKRGSGHAVEENLSVVEALAGKKLEGDIHFDIRVSEEDALRARDLLGSSEQHKGPVVVLSPTARWASKRWLPKRFAELADRVILERHGKIFFTGTGGDVSYIDEIMKMMKSSSTNLAGKTNLKVLAAVLKEADLVFSCDSGTMHLANALGTPVVALFGPTKPSYTGPYGAGSKALSANVECAPCRKRDCDDMRCMNEISVDELLNSAVEFTDVL